MAPHAPRAEAAQTNKFTQQVAQNAGGAKAAGAQAKNTTRKQADGLKKQKQRQENDGSESCRTRDIGEERLNSFAPGTLVRMADGSSKPIEQVEPGDTVLATDPDIGATRPEQVTAAIEGTGEKHLVDLTLVGAGAGGGSPPATITTTDGHRFYSPIRGWVEAADLRPGDQLRDDTGKPITVGATAHRAEPATVHNLTVSNAHTYYVEAGDESVLVHNCSLKYVTYTKTNPVTGEVYSGRTMGYGTPEEIVAARDASHHIGGDFGPAQVDKWMEAALPFSRRHDDLAYQAIRGREQNLIDFHGGARSMGGTSGNAIQGIADDNPLRARYMHAARRVFGLL